MYLCTYVRTYVRSNNFMLLLRDIVMAQCYPVGKNACAQHTIFKRCTHAHTYPIVRDKLNTKLIEPTSCQDSTTYDLCIESCECVLCVLCQAYIHTSFHSIQYAFLSQGAETDVDKAIPISSPKVGQ